MKVRLIITSLVSVVVAVVLCRSALLSSPNPQLNDSPVLGKQFSEGWVHDRDRNFVAKKFNGSKRRSIETSRIPSEAQQLAQDYRQIIYPSLQQFAVKNGMLPASLNAVPDLKDYVSLHPAWSTPQSYRVDGTMISRRLYSTNSVKDQHDPWTCYLVNEPGKPKLLIQGWDDGKVTCNTFEDNYFATVHTSIGDITVSAPPGATGIPPGTKQIKDTFKGL